MNVCNRQIVLFLLVIGSLSSVVGQKTTKDSLVSAVTVFELSAGFNPKDTVYINLLNKLADEYRYYQTDSLQILSKKALNLSKSSSFKRGESMALYHIGNYYSDQGSNTQAIFSYKEAQTIAKEINEKNLILRTSNNLAGEYGYRGNYDQALKGYLETIELAKEYNNQKMLSILNENVAGLYTSQKDYKEALGFYKEVKRINEGIGIDTFSAETLSNMASLYAEMGELEYAMFNINTSISVFEKYRIMDWLAYAYEIKGKIYLKQEKFKWALHWYNQSDLIHSNLQDERGQIELFNGMAEANLGLQNDSLAQYFALKAFDISSKLKFKEGIQKCANTLFKVHKNKKDFQTALEYHELYQEITDTLSLDDNKKGLTLLKTKMSYDKQKRDLIIENDKALARQRSYIYASLFILMIFLVVTYLVKKNERVQKKLNVELKTNKRELENSEKELKEINATKDRLFSIIGHDLRGPIGAFQGLLKLFREGEIDQKEFLSFIPKLGSDLDHISFTLNNLLSWGHTQMNGSVTKPSVISLDSLVSDNINLLSETAANKSIKIISQLSTNTLVWSDGNQIDIVIRNLMSNAIKFTPQNGMVTIGASEKTNHWELFVRDTGVGMDVETRTKIFSDNANVTTYGTNNEKGTGLGLSLCKEMIAKNNGTIWVDSMVRKGTSFYFTLPKANKQYQKAS